MLLTPEQIKDHRIDWDLSQQGLADVIGITEGRTVRRIEAGSSNVTGPVSTAVELLAHLQETQPDFFETYVERKLEDAKKRRENT